MARDQTVAPKERVNITYKPAGEATEEIELPLKLLVMGNFTQREDDRPLEERAPIRVDKDNFNDVLAGQQLQVSLQVPDRLHPEKKPGNSESVESLPVSLHFKTLRDFEPDRVAKQVPGLNQLLQIREALVSLKGPLGNVPAFRKKLQAIVTDVGALNKLYDELELTREMQTQEVSQ